MRSFSPRPPVWKDEKVYSAAAVAVDTKGRVVFMHLRTPYLMRDFAQIIADPRLALAAAMYVEGGPEASLYLHAQGRRLQRVGSYESFFLENDSNTFAWALPNVLAFAPSPTR